MDGSVVPIGKASEHDLSRLVRSFYLFKRQTGSTWEKVNLSWSFSEQQEESTVLLGSSPGRTNVSNAPDVEEFFRNQRFLDKSFQDYSN